MECYPSNLKRSRSRRPYLNMTNGAGMATAATRASTELPHPHPRLRYIVGAKMGRTHAVTERA